MTSPAHPAKPGLEYDLRLKVNEALWLKMHLYMRNEGYTLSEYVREAIRRDLRVRDGEVLAASTKAETDD